MAKELNLTLILKPDKQIAGKKNIRPIINIYMSIYLIRIAYVTQKCTQQFKIYLNSIKQYKIY